MKLWDIKNETSLNIFCDASIKKIGKHKYHGCYGAIAVFMDQALDDSYRICTDTTNNESEIKAIRSGVSIALKHRYQFQTINIISDSQISIFGIRDRIFRWNNVNGTICGYKQIPISNQSVFLEILDMITISGININFWHQKGHVSTRQRTSMDNAMHVFKSSNGIREDVDIGLIKYISFWNNKVDQSTRSLLYSSDLSNVYTDALTFYPSNFYEKLDQYSKLT